MINLNAENSFAAREPNKNSLENIKVLVVDDSADNQELIWQYLRRHGAIVEAAHNGIEGCEKALHGDHDIVLMDIQMPEMDGYTATEKLRSAGFDKPIIALTAHTISEVHARCVQAGCTSELSKPINFKELITTVENHTRL